MSRHIAVLLSLSHGHQGHHSPDNHQGQDGHHGQDGHYGQTSQKEQTGQTDLTFKLNFLGNLCRATFAILAMFFMLNRFGTNLAQSVLNWCLNSKQV